MSISSILYPFSFAHTVPFLIMSVILLFLSAVRPLHTSVLHFQHSRLTSCYISSWGTWSKPGCSYCVKEFVFDVGGKMRKRATIWCQNRKYKPVWGIETWIMGKWIIFNKEKNVRPLVKLLLFYYWLFYRSQDIFLRNKNRSSSFTVTMSSHWLVEQHLMRVPSTNDWHRITTVR